MKPAPHAADSIRRVSVGALIILTSCTSMPSVIAGDEVTGSGQFVERAPPRPAPPSDPTYRLLEKRVAVVAPLRWRVQRQEYQRDSGTMEWTLPVPAAASGTPAATPTANATLIAQRVAPESEMAAVAAPWLAKGTAISDASDGDDPVKNDKTGKAIDPKKNGEWRTLVLLTSETPPRVTLVRLALYAGVLVELSVSFPADAKETLGAAWVDRRVDEINRMLCALTIDGKNRCESLIAAARPAAK